MTDNEIIEKVSEHISAISSLLGIPVTESNKDTPIRVAKMYCNELFKNRNNRNLADLEDKMKLFPYEGRKIHESITISGIKFSSVCEHHWLPFMGEVTVTYVPSDKIIGLSKIPRVVKFFSQKPQLQERLTNEIGEYLVHIMRPLSLTVTIKSTHTCVMCRGAESECETTTTFTYG